MAHLNRNSYFKNLSANEIYSGEPHKIEGEYNTLKVSVQTDVSGVLSVYQSIDGTTYETYGDIFAVSQTTHKQVHIKGRYVYVEYENGGDATTNFSLFSFLSKSAASGLVGLQEVFVTNESLAVSGLTFDASNNLLVKSNLPVSERVNQILLNVDTLNSDSASPIFDVSGYKKSVLSYTDAQSAATSSLALYGSVDGTTMYYIGEILPVLNAHTNMRYATVSLDLAPFSHIQIINQSVETIGGIVCFLFGVN